MNERITPPAGRRKPLVRRRPSNRAQLEALERRGLSNLYEFGKVLAEIRRRELYRAIHPTWDEYLSARWFISRSYASRLITGAETLARLGRMLSLDEVPVLPERQVRAIKGKEPIIVGRVRAGESLEEAIGHVAVEAPPTGERNNDVNKPAGQSGGTLPMGNIGDDGQATVQRVEDLPGQVIRRALAKFIYPRFRQLDADERIEVMTEFRNELNRIDKELSEKEDA